ncbi:hypothetical protein PGT21_023762 [Puccinia graminis f. sp. tritici]|uniref:Uncharacterized protein n=2 Tax=Puccinia graminis f. sp. tritici TaxID=56615 RepID=A0A5B0LL29_PUCGR|nr:hypothetical protein PGT21_023762 [Puccinia graminis f. sp. tritici]
MVEANSTRATSKKIKESTTGKDKLEEIAITKALTPTGGNTDAMKSNERVEDTNKAPDGNDQALSGNSQFVARDNPRANENNKTIYSLITDTSKSRRDQAPVAMNIPVPANAANNEIRKEQASTSFDRPIVNSRDGRIESGYPRGCGYPLTISAETHIRIRRRIPASVGGYPRGYQRGYPRIPAL